MNTRREFLGLAAGAFAVAGLPGAVFAAMPGDRRFVVVLLRGATGVSRISNFLELHVLIGLWMLYLLVSHRWPVARHPESKQERRQEHCRRLKAAAGHQLARAA